MTFFLFLVNFLCREELLITITKNKKSLNVPTTRGGSVHNATPACSCLEPPLIEKLRPKRLPILFCCPNKDTIVTPTSSFVECGRDSSLPHPVLVVVGNSSPANEILFQVCNLHLGQTSPPHPPASYWAGRADAGRRGPLLEKTVPLSLGPHPYTIYSLSSNTDHFDTVNQLSSALPRHQFSPMWAPCPLISSLLSFPAILNPYVAITAAGQWSHFPFLCDFYYGYSLPWCHYCADITARNITRCPCCIFASQRFQMVCITIRKEVPFVVVMV